MLSKQYKILYPVDSSKRSKLDPDKSVQYLDDEPVFEFWEKVAKHE